MIQNRTKKFYEETKNLLESYYHAFYRKDIKKMHQIAKKKDKLLYEEFQLLHKKLNPDNLIIIHHLGIIIRRIHDMIGPFISYAHQD